MKLVAAVVFACGCMSPVMTFGAGKSAEEAQHDRITELMPVQLATEGAWRGEVRTAKIRVWADDDFRSQNVHWEHTFDEELEYANAVLAPNFGVRLVAEYKVWERHATASTLADDLDALMALDPGTDVMTVIGLVSALTLATATFEQLGFANVPGRHLVLRGYAEVGERKTFEAAFPKLRSDERDTVVEARRRHKTAAMLLHELGHNLGASHEDEPDTLMNPMYSHHSAMFSEHAREVIQRTLDGRLGRESSAPHVNAAAPRAGHGSLVISISLAGDTIVDGEPVDNAGLDALLKATAARDRDTEVVIRKPRKLPGSSMVPVLDKAKAAGLSRFTIANDP